MDGKSFDALTKRLCSARLSRMNTVRGLAGGILGVLTSAALPADDAEARKRDNAKKQDNTKQRDGKKNSGSKNRAQSDNHAGKEGRGKSRGKNDGKSNGGGKNGGKKNKNVCHCGNSSPN